MKFKTALLAFLAFVSAALWVPQAQAIPAFARQVGMACSACHYQHFPVLNSFGRAFKEGGFTMVGAQEKLESDGLSLPMVLNAALVGSAGYEKTNGPNTSTNSVKNSSNDGQFQMPAGVSLFAGGRAGEHVGFEAEIALNSLGTTGTAGLIRLKIPFVYDVGGVKAGIIPFSTALGPADSFEVLNTGAVAVHAFNQEDMPTVSAQQYIGTGGAGGFGYDASTGSAHGVAFIASNSDFFANIARWGATLGDGSGAPTSNYVRGAWTTALIPGFDSAIGFQNWSGNSVYSPSSGSLLVPGPVDTKAWAIDAQTMGDVGGLPLLVVASYARAPSDVNTSNQNLYNPTVLFSGNVAANPFNRESFNIGAELGVIPNVATVQLAFRHANSGFDAGLISGNAANGSNASDNAVLVGVTYALALNVRLEASYSKYSGDMYGSSVQAAQAAQGLTYMGDSLAQLTLWFGF